MSKTKDDLKDEIENRVKSHSSSFNPTVNYKESEDASNVVVYCLDIDEGSKQEYGDNYQDADKHWVKERGRSADYNIVAKLQCKWLEE